MGVEITRELIEGIRAWLGDDGVNFFTEIYDEHGKLNVYLSAGEPGHQIPHPVHFREGMHVRNKMRELTNYQWPNDEYENKWETVVLMAIGKIKGPAAPSSSQSRFTFLRKILGGER